MADNSQKRLLKAQSLFPDLFKGKTTVDINFSSDSDLSKPTTSQKNKYMQQDALTGKVKPPLPPDTSWLRDFLSSDTDQGNATDIPLSLIMIPDKKLELKVAQAISGLGYQVDTADNISESIEKMVSFAYSIIVLHTDFCVTSLEENDVHRYLINLPMESRRLIYYVLIGDELRTCYDLEAMSLSSNLVMNHTHADYLSLILKKGLREYEELFGLYINLLGVSK